MKVRSIFCVAAFSAAILAAANTAPAQTRIRLVAANITSGNAQSYDPGEGIRIFQGLDPDVAMIQEFNYGTNSAADIRAFVDTAFGTTYSYYREGGAQIPNGIISKYPIIASGEWDDVSVTNRDFAWARIDVPGTKDLWAISVHLLTANASTRNTEATNLKTFINANVPAGDYLVIGGDFNSDSRSEACFSTLSSLVASPATNFPVDQNNNGNTNASRAKPYDHVLVDPDLTAIKTSVVIGTSTYTNGLVFDSRVYTPLSQVSPVLVGDSGSTNMQHMAIVKDFLLPSGATATPTPTPTATTVPTATPTPTPTPTPVPTATPTPTPTVTPLPTATPTPTPTPTGGGTNLIISEYVEGSSNNKALEIYNPTAASIALSNYNIKVYFNGATSATTTITLSGTLAPGGCYVVAYTGSVAALLAKANLTFSSSGWNGDDAITLCQGTTVVDSIGQIGVDPGTAWGTTVSTADQSIRRNTGIVTGDTVTNNAFTTTEYSNQGLDYFTNLGVR